MPPKFCGFNNLIGCCAAGRKQTSQTSSRCGGDKLFKSSVYFVKLNLIFYFVVSACCTQCCTHNIGSHDLLIECTWKLKKCAVSN